MDIHEIQRIPPPTPPEPPSQETLQQAMADLANNISSAASQGYQANQANMVKDLETISKYISDTVGINNIDQINDPHLYLIAQFIQNLPLINPSSHSANGLQVFSNPTGSIPATTVTSLVTNYGYSSQTSQRADQNGWNTFLDPFYEALTSYSPSSTPPATGSPDYGQILGLLMKDNSGNDWEHRSQNDRVFVSTFADVLSRCCELRISPANLYNACNQFLADSQLPFKPSSAYDETMTTDWNAIHAALTPS